MYSCLHSRGYSDSSDRDSGVLGILFAPSCGVGIFSLRSRNKHNLAIHKVFRSMGAKISSLRLNS